MSTNMNTNSVHTVGDLLAGHAPSAAANIAISNAAGSPIGTDATIGAAALPQTKTLFAVEGVVAADTTAAPMTTAGQPAELAVFIPTSAQSSGGSSGFGAVGGARQPTTADPSANSALPHQTATTTFSNTNTVATTETANHHQLGYMPPTTHQYPHGYLPHQGAPANSGGIQTTSLNVEHDASLNTASAVASPTAALVGEGGAPTTATLATNPAPSVVTAGGVFLSPAAPHGSSSSVGAPVEYYVEHTHGSPNPTIQSVSATTTPTAAGMGMAGMSMGGAVFPTAGAVLVSHQHPAAFIGLGAYPQAAPVSSGSNNTIGGAVAPTAALHGIPQPAIVSPPVGSGSAPALVSHEDVSDDGVPISTHTGPISKDGIITGEHGSWCSANIFVANIPSFWTEEMLRDHYAPYGTIISAKAVPSRRFGFVRFSAVEEAQRAIIATDKKRPTPGLSLLLHVSMAVHDEGDGSEPNNRIFVRGLPEWATDQLLYNAVRPHAEPSKCSILVDTQRKCKGTAFVEFDTVEEAAKLMAAAEKVVLLGGPNGAMVKAMKLNADHHHPSHAGDGVGDTPHEDNETMEFKYSEPAESRMQRAVRNKERVRKHMNDKVRVQQQQQQQQAQQQAQLIQQQQQLYLRQQQAQLQAQIEMQHQQLMAMQRQFPAGVPPTVAGSPYLHNAAIITGHPQQQTPLMANAIGGNGGATMPINGLPNNYYGTAAAPANTLPTIYGTPQQQVGLTMMPAYSQSGTNTTATTSVIGSSYMPLMGTDASSPQQQQQYQQPFHPVTAMGGASHPQHFAAPMPLQQPQQGAPIGGGFGLPATAQLSTQVFDASAHTATNSAASNHSGMSDGSAGAGVTNNSTHPATYADTMNMTANAATYNTHPNNAASGAYRHPAAAAMVAPTGGPIHPSSLGGAGGSVSLSYATPTQHINTVNGTNNGQQPQLPQHMIAAGGFPCGGYHPKASSAPSPFGAAVAGTNTTQQQQQQQGFAPPAYMYGNNFAPPPQHLPFNQPPAMGAPSYQQPPYFAAPQQQQKPPMQYQQPVAYQQRQQQGPYGYGGPR